MIRLFVAIELEEGVKERLQAIAHGLPGARWIESAQLHLTLRFIGEVDGGVARDIREVLAGVRAESFSLQLEGVGCFPPRGNPRIVWVGVAENQELSRLQKKIESVLVRQVGLVPEQRRYSPHITLARLKNTPPVRVGRFLEEYGLFASHPFPVTHFSLYSSSLGRKRALHLVEEDYFLQPSRSMGQLNAGDR